MDGIIAAVKANSSGRSQKGPQSGNLADRFQTSAPPQPAVTQAGTFCAKCGARLKNNPVGYIKSHK